MANIIAVLNPKGGAGKTTIALHLSRELKEHGSVLMVDSDPQGSARDWAEQGGGNSFPIVGVDRAGALKSTIQQIAPSYDWVVIDGAAKLEEMAAHAVSIAELIIIPVQPSPLDLWACEALVSQIKQRQIITDGIPTAAFQISRAKKGNDKLSKIERVQHSHGALIPLNPHFNPYAPLSSLSDRDKVYSLLVRHTLKAVKKPAIIKEARFNPDLSSINNKEFFNIISQYRDKVDYKFISRTIKSHDKPEFPYYPEILPNGVNLGIEKRSKDCGYRLIQKDLMVALLLVRYGLSRPSTFAYHSEKISKRYINDENTLNAHAKSSLLKASQVAPVLCDLKTYHELDNIFANNEMTLHEKIALSLEIITKKDTAEGQTTEKVKSSEISPFR